MSSILLLNAANQPLSTIPLRRAISLLLRDKVDPISTEAELVRGCTTILRIPRVLRLRRYIQTPQAEARWSRKAVLARDGYRCIYCGVGLGERRREGVLSKRDLTIDHILPKSRGGSNTWVNTACACAPCNQRKADRMPHEAGMKLLWEPKTPRTDYLVASGVGPHPWKIKVQLKP